MAENKKDKLKTEIFLTGIIDDNTANKFIEETQDIIDRLRIFGEEKASLFLMDNELLNRQYTFHDYKN